MQRTGGGPSLTPSEQLTAAEEQVLETFDVTAINGHDNIAETGVSFVCTFKNNYCNFKYRKCVYIQLCSYIAITLQYFLHCCNIIERFMLYR